MNPLELSDAEQAVLDGAIAAVNAASAHVYSLEAQRQRQWKEVLRQTQMCQESHRTVLLLKGLDPGQYEGETNAGRVTLRLKRPGAPTQPGLLDNLVSRLILDPHAAPSTTANAFPLLVIPWNSGGLADETRRLGESLDATFVEMRTRTSYFEMLDRLWTAGQTFVLLEQDVVPDSRVLFGMADCAAPWCAGCYEDDKGDLFSAALGLNKFSAEFLASAPQAMARVAEILPQRVWTHVDFALLRVLREARLEAHRHLPAMKHLHRYNSLPPVVSGELESGLQRVLDDRLMVMSEIEVGAANLG